MVTLGTLHSRIMHILILHHVWSVLFVLVWLAVLFMLQLWDFKWCLSLEVVTQVQHQCGSAADGSRDSRVWLIVCMSFTVAWVSVDGVVHLCAQACVCVIH